MAAMNRGSNHPFGQVGNYRRVTLGEVCVAKTGTFNPTTLPEAPFTYVDIASIDGTAKEITAPQRLFGKDAPSRARRSIKAGDVIVSMTRPNLNAVAMVPPSLDGQVCSTGFCVLRAGDEILPEYIFHYVRSASFVEYVSGLVSGALYPAVTEAQVRGSLIPLPSLEEQHRIVDILNHAASIRRLREEARAKARQVIPALFLDMFGDPATNPMGWPTSKIGELGLVQLGRQRAPKYQTGNHSRPYIRVANVFEDEIDVSDVLMMDFDESDFQKYRLSPGDILLNEGQSTELVGRPAMWSGEIEDCCFQNTLVRFVANQETVDPMFALAAFLHYYRTGVFSCISSKTSNVAHLGAGRFANLPLFVPPLDLQRRFAQFSEDARSATRLHDRAVEAAEQMAQSLLAQIFGQGG